MQSLYYWRCLLFVVYLLPCHAVNQRHITTVDALHDHYQQTLHTLTNNTADALLLDVYQSAYTQLNQSQQVTLIQLLQHRYAQLHHYMQYFIGNKNDFNCVVMMSSRLLEYIDVLFYDDIMGYNVRPTEEWLIHYQIMLYAYMQAEIYSLLANYWQQIDQ